jgi:hypothetical protein
MMNVSGYPVSASSLLEGAKNYLAALETLSANPKGELLEPMGLLASQAVELALKAYLLHIGWSERDLRTVVGHDLNAAWREATSKGLRIHWEHRFSIELLSLSHDSPYLFRYPRDKLGAAITGLDVLCRDVRAVIASVEDATSA